MEQTIKVKTNTETRHKLSADKKWIITETVITDIKSVKYFEAMGIGGGSQ